MRTQEVLAAVLQPVLFLIQESTVEDYESIILPSFRYRFQKFEIILNHIQCDYLHQIENTLLIVTL